MIINPSKHEVTYAESPVIKEIPLSYIDTENNEYKTDIRINENFVSEKKEQIMPYQKFDNSAPIFVNSNNDILNNIVLKTAGNKYRYEPKGMAVYTPQDFSAKIVIKKREKYRSDKVYNITVVASEANENISFSRKLITFFGDAAQRNLCPSNIKINNASMLPESLISNNINDSDFIFIESSDGIHTSLSEGEALIDFDTLLKVHTNIWLSVESFSKTLTSGNRPFPTNNSECFSELRFQPSLYSDITYAIDKNKFFSFELYNKNTDFPDTKYEYMLLHPGVLLLHKENEGYIIVTPKEMLENVELNAHLLYEIMMHIYLQSYIETKWITSWITENPVDYVAMSSTPYRKNHKSINLDQLLKEKDISGYDYDIVNIFTDSENIMFANIQDSNITFKKIKDFTDIPKTENQVSYLTSAKNIINYSQEDIWFVKTKLNISYTADYDKIMLIVYPFINSYQKVYSLSKQTLFIENNNLEYTLCATKTEGGVQSILKLIPTEVYDKDSNDVELAQIRITSYKNIKLYDTRVFGGGLPLSEKDDYEMMDISNPNGRPYRIGSTLVIKLPKKLKDYDERIQFEVKKHISAGDYPVFVYEEEHTKGEEL